MDSYNPFSHMLQGSSTGTEATVSVSYGHTMGKHLASQNDQPLDCLYKSLFRLTSKVTSEVCITGLCEENLSVIGGFPTQRATNAESASMWWCHHTDTQPKTRTVYLLVLLLLFASECMWLICFCIPHTIHSYMIVNGVMCRCIKVLKPVCASINLME